jgi:hypothetical protein
MSEKLYETRNVLRGKWGAVVRLGAWSVVFIYGFMMFLTNFVRFQVYPHTRWFIQPQVPANPRTWWVALGASLFTGLFVGLLIIVGIALNIRAQTYLVYGDRLQVRLGRFHWDIPFKDITAVERISFVPFLRLGAFWTDLKEQIQTDLLTPRYKRVGAGQALKPRATLVLVKVSGRRWWRGYLFDVDNPDEFLQALEQALARYRSAEAQTQAPSTSSATA